LAGRAPAEIADDLGLATPTVRSHLATIYAKTGTSRQSDLVRLATQLAAPVGRRMEPLPRCAPVQGRP
jgi:DNA-binding CsgD family transcriptional regulator